MSVKKSETSKNTVKASQVVMLAPESVSCLVDGSEAKITSLQLRHPSTGVGHEYLLRESSGELYQVIEFSESYRSWFINNSVQPDGRLHIMTAVEPVFFILPYLIRASSSSNKKGSCSVMYQQLDSLLEDSDYPDTRLLTGCRLTDLHLVANVKGCDDFAVYKYDENLTMEWLKNKVDQVCSALRSTNVNPARGSSGAATFVRSSKYADSSEDEYTRYACDLVGEYLQPELLSKLKTTLGVPVTDVNENTTECGEPATKRSKVEESPVVEPSNILVEKQMPKKVEKKTPAQKLLSKADTTGMKSLSSFFSAKNGVKK